jgi:hypothetical protein
VVIVAESTNVTISPAEPYLLSMYRKDAPPL